MNKIVNPQMMSAVKRKNIKDMLALMLSFDGNVEGADKVSAASRLTEKLLKDVGCYDNGEPEEVEEVEPCCETEEVEVNTEDPFQFNELDALIAQGKKKKAKKLLKEIKATGLKGSELSKRKALVKGL